VTVDGDTGGDFPERRFVSEERADTLRYGENPIRTPRSTSTTAARRRVSSAPIS